MSQRPVSMGDMNLNEEALAGFYQRFEDLEKYCVEKKIPSPLVEGRMRDWLAMVEAMRMANPLIQSWKRQGVQSFILPKPGK